MTFPRGAFVIRSIRLLLCGIGAVAAVLNLTAQSSPPLSCDLEGYRPGPGLLASVAGGEIAVSWLGESADRLSMTFALRERKPVIRMLTVQRDGGTSATVLSDASPEYEITMGYRRATDQQLNALRALGTPITPELVDRIKWDTLFPRCDGGSTSVEV